MLLVLKDLVSSRGYLLSILMQYSVHDRISERYKRCSRVEVTRQRSRPGHVLFLFPSTSYARSVISSTNQLYQKQYLLELNGTGQS